MMFRLVAKTGLAFTVIAILAIVASLALGSTLPQDLQYIWSLPRQNRWQTVASTAPFQINNFLQTYFRAHSDQWSTVGLYSTTRRLSATRQLPITAHAAIWDVEGRFAAVTGSRNQIARTYQMYFMPGDGRVRWLKTASSQPFSPDGQWAVVHQHNASGEVIGLKAVPAEQIDQYTTLDEKATSAPQLIMWSRDSSAFLYSLGSPSRWQQHVIQPTEVRLFDVRSGTEKVLDDPNLDIGQYVNTFGAVWFELVPKEQPFTAEMLVEPYRRFTTVVHDSETGAETKISDEGVTGATWSGSQRYLLYYEDTPTITEGLMNAASRIFSSGPAMGRLRGPTPVWQDALYGGSGWFVLYHPNSRMLISSTQFTSQFTMGNPYQYGFIGYGYIPGPGIYSSRYGYGYGSGMGGSTAYIFDRQTGETWTAASSRMYGPQYMAYWLEQTDILMINSLTTGSQYYVKPGEEPKLLQYGDKNLVLTFNGVRTLATPAAVPSSANISGPHFSVPYGGIISQPPILGQAIIPEYYLVNLIRDSVEPVTFESNEVAENFDYTLTQQYGIDVSVVSTRIYSPNMTGSSGPYPSNIYLLTEDGLIPAAKNFPANYVQSFGIDENQFILVPRVNPRHMPSQQEALYVVRRDGQWQVEKLVANFAGLMSWRPPEDTAPASDAPASAAGTINVQRFR